MLSTIFSATTLWWVLMVLYVPSCIGLILIVLMQKGKGGGFAGAFGAGGGSDAMFGPRTARSLPQKITYTMAAIFMVFAFVLSFISGKATRGPAPGLLPDSQIGAVTAPGEETDADEQAITVEIPTETEEIPLTVEVAPPVEEEAPAEEESTEEAPAEADEATEEADEADDEEAAS